MPHSQIDEQVVKMSFDNSNFDSNISDSIKALNNLDTKLFSINKDQFDKLTNSVNNLANTFTIKGQIMFGVLTRLGNKIYDLGNRAFGTLFRGIKDGIGEYNTIIESTESIYQNVKQSGNSLQDVIDSLDELNDYADKTIYNFGQMTRMIGMFTSAGVGLNSSVSTIKGLANSAALVGANMQKAQIAWNAVSRAMSSGKFTNVTWRSLELSGIAGKQFNKVITEVARTMKVKGKQTGKDIDGMIKKWGSLRESLREGWLDNRVFTEAMNIMSGAMDKASLKKNGYTKKQINELLEIAKAAEEAATRVKTFKQLLETTAEAIGSGWAQSFRILIGDLEEAKKLYTRISNVLSDFIDNNARIRNTLFKQIVNGKDRDINKNWRTGRDNFRQIIENMMATVKTFFKAVEVGFLNIFPIERISRAARKVLDTVQKFTKALVLNEEEANSSGDFIKWDTTNIDKVSKAIKNLIRFFRGLAAAVDIAWMAISQPIKVIIKHVPFLNNFFKNTNNGLVSILERLGAFGDKITVFQNAVKQTNFFGALLEILINNIDELSKKYPVIGAIVWAFRSLKKVIIDTKNNLKKLNIKPISTAFGIFKFIVTAVWRGLNAIFGLIQNIGKSLDFSWLDKPKKYLSNAIKTFSDYGKGLLEFEDIAGNVKDFFVNAFLKVKESTSGFFSVISEKAKAIKNTMVNAFDTAKKAIKDFGEKIKTSTSNIKNQFSGVGTSVEQAGNKVQSVWDKIKGFFKNVSDFFSNLTKNSDNTVDGIIKKIALLAGAVAASAFTISTISKTFGKMRIFANISELLKSGVDVIKAYQREAQTKTILNIAIAIGILAASMTAMAFIPYENMENGLIMFSSFMATIALTLVPLINSIALLNQAIANRKNITNTQAFFNIFGDFGKKIAKGINAKAFGKACIYFAISVGIIVAAIVILKKTFNNIDDFEKSANIIIRLMITMGTVLGIVTFALTLMTKTFKKGKSAVVNVFSSFFTLVGVSHVIIAIALAIGVLTQSLIALSKVDMEKTVGYAGLMFAAIAMIGGIGIAISAILANSKSFGKLKDIAVVLVAASASLGIVILSYIALMKMMDSSNPERWWQPLLTFSLIIGQFTALVSVLLGLSKKVGGRAEYWNQLNKFLIIITACLTTLAAGLYLLTFAGKIDDSIISIISILTQAALAITIFVGILTATSKAKFSTNFLKVIQGISFAVSAFAAAVGILAIGLSALVKALDSVDLEATDSKNTSNKFIQKVEKIANVIKDAIPSLKKLFYSVGQAIGEVFASFVAGFLEKIIEVGDQYTNIIDKIINILIDIVGKIVTVLYSRKQELLSIFNKVADLIVSLFTNAFNQAFRRGETETPIKESTVSKFLGLGAIFTAFTAFAGKINTVQSFVKENAAKTAELLNKINNKLIKDTTGTTKLTTGQYITMAAAIIAAFKSASLAAKGMRQVLGKEAAYIRTDIQGTGDAIIAFFTDSEFRAQGLMYTMALIGRFIINLVGSIVGILGGIGWNVLIKPLVTAFGMIMTPISEFANVVKDILGALGLLNKETEDFLNNIANVSDNVGKFMNDVETTLARGAFSKWGGLFDFQLGDFQKASIDESKLAGYESAKAFADGYSDASNKVIEPVAADVSKNLGNTVSGKIGDLVNGTISPLAMKAKNKVSKDFEEVGKGIAPGASKGVDETKKTLFDSISTMGTQGKEMLQAVWKTRSPSKVAEDVYRNVVMGGVLGINKNKKKLDKAMSDMLEYQESIAKSGVGAINGVMQALGISYTPDRIRTPEIDIYDYDEKTKKTVLLNKEYLEIMKEQSKEFEGKSREYAYLELKRQALAKGLMFDAIEAKNVIDAVLSNSSNKFNVTAEGISNVVERTTKSVEDVVGRDAAALQLVITDAMNDYNEMMNIARDHSDELVGKKKEEVQEYLYQEGLKRGMTEETAKQMSKAVSDELFEQKKADAEITKEELLNKIDTYDEDYKVFCATEKAKTAFLDKMEEARAKIRASGVLDMREKLRTGQITAAEYSAWAHSDTGSKAIADYNSAQKMLNDSEKAYNAYVKGQKEDIIKRGMKTEEELKKAQEEAKKYLNESASAQRGTYTSLWESLKNLLNGNAPGINLDPWDQKDPEKKKKKKKPDPEQIKAAADTKKKLEENRADLTPTFDLDKLASDANKANGIVMSSLTAAQNAAIGSYINTNSELNPFMKDRWQNVYNFTQNNYSPKALSRIDIYRQTQRQLSMSRGF